MIAGTTILEAVEQVIDGELGNIRTVPLTAISKGHFPITGQTIKKPRFDVQIVSNGANAATPLSNLAPSRLENVAIQVNLYHDLPAAIKKTKTREARGLVALNTDRCMQALSMPGNLTTTTAGSATDIVSGVLTQLTSNLISEDWTAKPQKIQTQITGIAIVKISQPTS